MYKLIDGKKLAQTMRADIAAKVAAYKEENGREIGLAVILVGEDPASQVYVRNKIKACDEVGIKSYAYRLDKDTPQARVEELVRSLAVDNKINGILVQLPLPGHLDADKILSLIPFSKDVDGFSAENMGKLCMGDPCLVACTPNGVMKMFESENITANLKEKTPSLSGVQISWASPWLCCLPTQTPRLRSATAKRATLKKNASGRISWLRRLAGRNISPPI